MTATKRKPGRPKLLNASHRTIIQVEEMQLKQIRKLLNNKMSVSNFFRIAAEHVLDNPTILSGHIHEKTGTDGN